MVGSSDTVTDEDLPATLMPTENTVMPSGLALDPKSFLQTVKADMNQALASLIKLF